ncbi:hypothetical protein NQ318_021337 [Aromia moschata]|uniref:Moesin/ezrin/radixin homolog 1 n=1 Tax=Aromia moschata TaxID=1265417 RepID=A0AAV8ZEU9_9CUCU|nr:hypothetical protein NQ318_021337 [Aromia moschata]
MKVVVRTVQHESALEASPKTSVREIFNLICKSLGIQETWYFGLMFHGPDNEDVWVDQSKKTLRDLRQNSTNLHFKVKYYPEDIGEELIETVTIEFFFLEVKSSILKDEVYCPADTCVLLASYALQAKYGDYNKDEHNEDILKRQKLLPDRVTKQHALNASDWHASITNMWIKHNGLDKEEAMLEYLKLVQNLEMYGVTYYRIKNRKGTDVLLGVTALGLNIYKEDDRLNPTVAFPWSEIKNLKFKDKKFLIKPADKTAKDFVLFAQSGRMSKYILNLGIGNHSLYVRRRKPDTPEVAKMKEKANEVRKSRHLQKQKYYSEKSLREEAEQREVEYKKQIQRMKEEMERSQQSLLDAQKTIQKLQQQLDELQRTKEELETQRNQLREMMDRLEQSKNMEAAERQKLEDEIRAKHEEVLRIQEEVERRDAEAKRLQEEVEESKRREEELRRKQLEEAARREEEERQRQEEQELETIPEDADTSLPELQQVNEQLKEQLKLIVWASRDHGDLFNLPKLSHSGLKVILWAIFHDFDMKGIDDAFISLFRTRGKDKARANKLSINVSTQQEINVARNMIQNKLEASRHHEEDTTLDKIHRINLLEGRDKYKTLADIRRGNTIRRVEMFENM